MKTSKIAVLIDRSDYRAFAEAARLARQASGKEQIDTQVLIKHHFGHRDPIDLAKDYLDATGEVAARRSVGIQLAGRAGDRGRDSGRHRRSMTLPFPGAKRPGRAADSRPTNSGAGPQSEDFSRN